MSTFHNVQLSLSQLPDQQMEGKSPCVVPFRNDWYTFLVSPMTFPPSLHSMCLFHVHHPSIPFSLILFFPVSLCQCHSLSSCLSHQPLAFSSLSSQNDTRDVDSEASLPEAQYCVGMFMSPSSSLYHSHTSLSLFYYHSNNFLR